jgi:hypothetical protein
VRIFSWHRIFNACIARGTSAFVVKDRRDADFADHQSRRVIRRFFPTHDGITSFTVLPTTASRLNPVVLRKAALTERKRNRPLGSTASGRIDTYCFVSFRDGVQLSLCSSDFSLKQIPSVLFCLCPSGCRCLTGDFATALAAELLGSRTASRLA